ncbi:uncharacterized protein LOC114828575 [Galendromus occidentalis]|uniref:Uncharacterized protein LOC114828575 n=1 Tax=Galendromus occidentalis TaxID=34638 RepID=A0AAJ7SJF9_9ACAR|nr:uncharacterized protein LOC114828575 [Galendromus occidentalis]
MKVLQESSRDLRVQVFSRPDNVLFPFIQDVHWVTEDPRKVHGPSPTIECAGLFKRCSLCIQHALCRSLPSALRQKYLQHDHPYVNPQSEREAPLISRVALDLMQRNYEDAFTNMISHAKEKTNPFRIATGTGDCHRDPVKQRSSRILIEEMENTLSSPFAEFDEVEVHTSPNGLGSQLPDSPDAMENPSQGGSSFPVKIRRGAEAPTADSLIERDSSRARPLLGGATGPNPHEEQISNRLRREGAQTHVSDYKSHLLQKTGVTTSRQDPGASNLKACRAPWPRGTYPSSLGSGETLTSARATERNDFARPGSCRIGGSASELTSQSHLSDATHLYVSAKRQFSNAASNTGGERGLTRTINAPSPFHWKTPYVGPTENLPPSNQVRPMQPFEVPPRFDQLNPRVNFPGPCSNTFGISSGVGLPPRIPNSEFYSDPPGANRISARCPVCGITFRTFGVVKGKFSRVTHVNPQGRLRDHMALHRADGLDCVFPSCRGIVFDHRDELIAHMDAHRQALIFAGVERWENQSSSSVSLPRFLRKKPNLTCEICLIDFNWRTTLSGMPSHTERYIKHCERHLVKMGENDYCPWQCALRSCEKKFTSQHALEEHMWMVHAASCHCSTCDWIVWGETDEVNLHRTHCTCTAQLLADGDSKPFGMRLATRHAATAASAPGQSCNEYAESAAKNSSAVPFARIALAEAKPRLKWLRNKTSKSAGEPASSKFDTASSANHLMRFTYYCDFCGAPFRSHHLKQYQRHVQSHLPDKQLSCVISDCDRRFDSLEELHSHVKTKLSTCRYCGAVLFLNYKKHILTCRPLHEIKKQRLLKEEFAKIKYEPLRQEDLHWSHRKLCRSNPSPERGSEIPESESQECFLRNLNLIKGDSETITEKTRKHEMLRSQIHVANGKGRRACTEKTSCVKCGRIFRNGLNLREHMRGYHNARDF